MTPIKAADNPARKKEEVLTKAVFRTSDLLGIERKDLSEITGISEATLSRMSHGESAFSLGSKQGEAATQLVRIYRSLDSVFGGKSDSAQNGLGLEIIISVEFLSNLPKK